MPPPKFEIFSNLFGKLHFKFLKLDVRLCFTCGELNRVKLFPNIKPKIASLFLSKTLFLYENLIRVI